MLLAVKGNREFKIEEKDKKHFIEDGFKIIGIDGSGKHKVLHDPVASGKAQASSKLVQELADEKAKNKKLEAQVAEQAKAIKEIRAELLKVTKKGK